MIKSERFFDPESSILLNAIHVFALNSMAVGYPLYSFLRANPAYFATQGVSPSAIYGLVLVVSIVLPLAFVLGTLGCRVVHATLYSYVHMIVVALYLFLAFLPLSRGWSILPLGLSVFLVFVVAGLALHQYATNRMVYMGFSILVLAAVAFPVQFLTDGEIQQSLASRSEDSHRGVVVKSQKTAPILLVVFDELPVVSLMDAEGGIDAHRFPRTAQFASGATWYPNATTVYDYTVMAVPAIVSGQFSSTGMVLPYPQNYPTSLFALLRDDYTVHALEQVTSLVPDVDQYAEREDAEQKHRRFIGDLFVMYVHAVFPESIADRWVPMDENLWGGFMAGQGDSARHAGQQGDQPLTGGMAAVTAFTKEMGAFPEATLHFLHVPIPHQPFKFLPSGRRYNAFRWTELKNSMIDASPRPTVLSHYQRHAHLLQVGYVDTVVGNLLDMLTENGSYDDMLIVITSDHGVAFNDGGAARVMERDNVAELAYVPLIIKYPHQAIGVVDTRNAQTVDIVPTILDVVDASPLPEFDGRSLLGSNESDPGMKRMMNTDGRIIEIAVSDGVRELDSARRKLVRQFNIDNPRSGLYQYGPHLNYLGLSETEVAPNAEKVTVVSPDIVKLENFDAHADLLHTLISGSVDGIAPESANRLELLVGVNGIIEAQTSLFLVGSEVVFYTIFAEGTLEHGRNSINFYVSPKNASDAFNP